MNAVYNGKKIDNVRVLGYQNGDSIVGIANEFGVPPLEIAKRVLFLVFKTKKITRYMKQNVKDGMANNEWVSRWKKFNVTIDE